MRKIVIPLLVFFILILAACSPSATATPEAVEPTQAPTQTPEMVDEPTAEPTKAPTNTAEPTAVPPTPTEEPPSEPEVFISSGVTQEELADKPWLGEILALNADYLKAATDKDINQFSLELRASGLSFPLIEDGPFTVFAPVYKLEDVPEGLGGAQFIDALRYHIVPGLYLEADLLALDGQSLATLAEGKNINITVKDGVVYLNDVAMVVQADILARNGVSHVIDKFLLPPTE
jgi:uncharacterized surface protein with fasciclin (FAS1) repeats